MQSAFSRATSIRLSQPRIFGLQLQPITLGHLFLLETLGSPILGETEPDFSDIGIAVFACHQPAEQSERDFRRWWFPLFLRIWAMFAKPEWIAEDLPRFREYLADGLSSPVIRPACRGDGAASVCNAPAPWLKLFFAMHVLGMSRAEAMDTPVAELNALYATWAEWNGSGEIVGETMLSAIDGLWEHVAKVNGSRN